MAIQRDTKVFTFFEKNYWRYYRELESEFLQTRRYVEFCEDNNKAYSIEFLKLYQAVCSEIDVIGKAMAKLANDSFEPEDKKNNIQKWWYEIQDEYLLTEGPFTYMNPSSSQKRFGLVEYKCVLVDEIELQPWKNYRIEKYKQKNGHIGYRLEGKSQTPSWWSDYNKVKHHRTSSIGKEETQTNYSKANLGNLSNAFSALYILERAFMDMVGTGDDLSCFMDYSGLFVKPRRYTCEEMDELFAQEAVLTRVK